MERLDNNLYASLRRRVEGSGKSSMYEHDEEKETEFIQFLKQYKKQLNETYFRSVLHPEAHTSKIPSRMPVESAVAPLKYNFSITPNATGKFALIIDPFNSVGWLYQDSGVNGTGGGTVTNFTFAQDAAIIDQWRLVSSSLIVKYHGNFQQLSGFFVAATTSNVTAATQTTYLTFSNVEDLQNRQVLKAVDGVKLIYNPMDEKATEFHSQTSYTAGTHPCRWQYLFVVIGDLLPNIGSLRVDFFRNIEYTSTPAYKEYIPQNRDIPCDAKYLSNIDQVAPAPIDFRGGKKKAESVSGGLMDTVTDFVGGLIKDTVGAGLQSLNPFVMKNNPLFLPLKF